jgi:YggT family protein
MIFALIATFLNIFVPLFSGILLLRIILSYIVSPTNRLLEALMSLTEPVLAPIRKVLPATGGVDFSPVAALFLLQGLQYLVNGFLSA